ncbi:MAG: hypothetical protein KKE86_12215 [Planctomycetes bacterium]|nr:hypothetical protein [Planctomycetota bacterium]MBU4400087.1 hypothetical protein [Planctomycetota bacterium]MCG2684840.1 hypothetical protein [Planctomycetales bacterium]
MRRLTVGLMALTVSVLCGLNGHAAVLMGSWKLDEAEGTVAYDSSGNGMHGIIYGSPTPLLGGGFHFDGIDDYIDIPGTSDWNFASGFTLKARIRYTDPQPYPDTAIISNHRSGVTPASGYGLLVQSPLYNNQLWLFAQPGEMPIGPCGISGGTYQDGNWHDVIGIYDGTALSLYVDGELKAHEDSWNYSSFSTENVRIASYIPGGKFHGDIADVQIYAGAIPEPATLIVWSLLAGLGITIGYWRRRRAA